MSRLTKQLNWFYYFILTCSVLNHIYLNIVKYFTRFLATPVSKWDKNFEQEIQNAPVTSGQDDFCRCRSQANMRVADTQANQQKRFLHIKLKRLNAAVLIHTSSFQIHGNRQ